MPQRSCILAVALAACSSASFEGLAPARDQGGPKVRFDLSGSPLPEVPFPSDLLTRPDPDSPTGIRLNASLLTPSLLQGSFISALDTLDGFGTFAPITVSFDRPIDVLDLYARQNDADPGNDGVYLVDLAGGTVPLDVGGGRFPYTSIDPGRYFPADPDAFAFNLLFPVSGPFANFLHPDAPHASPREQADDLLGFYERQTNTLIVRPVLPLRQRSRYAVVLTSRVRGLDGKPISSPHPGINHAAQTQELRPLLSRLPPGTRLEDVAYAWAFTTQSITGDLDLIRSGLRGNGVLQRLSSEYPVEQGLISRPDLALDVLQERGAFVQGQPSANAPDYVLPAADLLALLTDPAIRALPFAIDPGPQAKLVDSWRYVDYFVSGLFVVPSFLEGPGGRFFLDPRTGAKHASPEAVTFLLAVPKEQATSGHLAPFPVVLAGHDFGSNRLAPAFAFAGTFAKFGVATLAFDAAGHGLALDAAGQQALRDAAKAHGLDAFAEVMLQGRARDLDGDGQVDPGANGWTADAFHSRDFLRQSAVDWMQAVRLLRALDGVSRMAVGNQTAVGGDFNGDGIPDIGGAPTFATAILAADGRTHVFEKGERNPGADLFAFGVGLGGITAAILPGLEPDILAAAPASGGGGLADVLLRTTLPALVRPVFLGLMGPLVLTCPFDRSQGPLDPQTQAPAGACAAAGASTLVLATADLDRERDIPIAPLSLSPGQQVMVRNLEQAPPGADCRARPVAGCAAGTADAQGAVRLSIAADPPSLVVPPAGSPARAGDRLEIVVFDALGVEQRRITTFEVESRFGGADHLGLPLFTPVGGFGLARNTPAFRRMLGLTQLILEPADPVNYASRYGPTGVLQIGTAGDPVVPVSAAIALGRAVGVVPLAPDPDYGIPIDDVLIRAGVVEGVPATRRFDDPNAGAWAALPGHLRCDPGADCTGEALADPGGYSCGAAACADGLQAPRLDPPLRGQLVRETAPAGPCPVNKRAGAGGCYSAGASACAPAAPAVSALLLPLTARAGGHALSAPDASAAFDVDQFIANAVGRFFECRGRELRFDACQQDVASCPWVPAPP